MKTRLLLLLLLMQFYSVAQSYFDKEYNFWNSNYFLSSVLPDTNGYYITGSNIYGGGVNAYFIKLNKQGDTIRKSVFSLPNKLIYIGNKCLFKIKDNAFQCQGYTDDTSGMHRTIFIKWDSLGNVTTYKEINHPCDSTFTNLFINKSILLPSGYTIGAGNYICNSNQGLQDIILMKFDPDYNLVWYKTYGVANKNEWAYSLALASDGGFIIGANRNNSSPPFGSTLQTYESQAYVIKTDSNGNQEWSYLSDPSRLTSIANGVIETPDSGIIYTALGDGYHVPTGANYSDKYGRCFMEKLDKYGHHLWDAHYSKYLFTNGVYFPFGSCLTIKGNGNIIVGGLFNDSTVYDLYSVMETDPLGKVVRRRNLPILNEPDTAEWKNFHNEVVDMKLLPDGNLVLAGFLVDGRPNGAIFPTERGRIIVLDSNFCIGPADTSWMHTNVVKLNNSPKTKVNVFPNPASNEVCFSTPFNTEAGLNIFTSKGDLYWTNRINGSIVINTAQWPAGVYHYQLVLDDNKESGSIVIVH